MFTQRELDNYAGPVYRRGLEEGVKKGAARRNVEIARAMLAKGYDVKSIIELTGINPDEKA